MSLKFGIYLVEQRIITPEQFCGLVKIQQDSVASIATIALRKNALTIKQVSTVLDHMETRPQKAFIEVALEEHLIDRADANQLLHHQQATSPTLQKLLVECGLLTQRQTDVLYLHFERQGVAQPEAFAPAQTQITKPAAPAKPAPTQKPRQPNFQRRPVVVRQYNKS